MKEAQTSCKSTNGNYVSILAQSITILHKPLGLMLL
jgi:hypothetical protein